MLIISTDPAHSLGDALAEQLNGRPRQVAAGWQLERYGSINFYMEVARSKGRYIHRT